MVAGAPRYRNVERRFGQPPVEIAGKIWAEYVKYTLKGVQAVVFFRQVSACISLDTGTMFAQRTHVCSGFAEITAKQQSFLRADVDVWTMRASVKDCVLIEDRPTALEENLVGSKYQ